MNTVTYLPRTDDEFKVVAQEHWDVCRDTQVRTYLQMKAEAAMRHYQAALKTAVDKVAEKKDEYELRTIYGSYKFMDTSEKKSEEYFDWFVDALRGVDCDLVLKRYMMERNVVPVYSYGKRTGVMRFSDGSLRVSAPGSPILVSSGDSPTDIFRVNTVCCYLMYYNSDKMKLINAKLAEHKAKQSE